MEQDAKDSVHLGGTGGSSSVCSDRVRDSTKNHVQFPEISLLAVFIIPSEHDVTTDVRQRLTEGPYQGSLILQSTLLLYFLSRGPQIDPKAAMLGPLLYRWHGTFCVKLALVVYLRYMPAFKIRGMSYFDVEEEEKKFHEKHPPCYGLRKEFVECITQSDCFLKEGKNFKECIKPGATGVSPECRSVQQNFFDCKRSLLDMRTRFRGRKGY